MTIVVHHLENSRSQRVLWLLEELGVAYRVKRYARDPVTKLAPPTLKEFHALGKSPLVQHDNLTVAETGAIVEHLVGVAESTIGLPIDEDAAKRYTYFMHYAEGSLMPPLYTLIVIGRTGGGCSEAVDAVRRGFAEHLLWMERELDSRNWFAADSFTAADVMMSFPLEAARHLGLLDASYPNLHAFLARIHARPAYQQALARGGPYAFA
ncbi:glutathione S-transferase family protein [Cupriavidus sp. 2KB_3]|uniref:glutathione S-transferase family protein n=1 Tax=Cupriavidus sp. 2KB_3 TaxID=3232980 RepID=UPI003F9017D3